MHAILRPGSPLAQNTIGTDSAAWCLSAIRTQAKEQMLTNYSEAGSRIARL